MALDAYKTDKIALAAFLIGDGHTVQDFEFANDRKTWARFVFHATSSLGDAVEEFTSGKALVEPQNFEKYLRIARDSLYDYMDTQGVGF